MVERSAEEWQSAGQLGVQRKVSFYLNLGEKSVFFVIHYLALIILLCFKAFQ